MNVGALALAHSSALYQIVRQIRMSAYAIVPDLIPSAAGMMTVAAMNALDLRITPFVTCSSFPL